MLAALVHCDRQQPRFGERSQNRQEVLLAARPAGNQEYERSLAAGHQSGELTACRVDSIGPNAFGQRQ